MTQSSDDERERARLILAAARGEPLHGDVVTAIQPTGVMGTLAQMSLTEIMQMMDFAKKSARVDVYLKKRRGEVHVHDGQIVRAHATSTTGEPHADASDAYGEAAFLLLCREPEGFFRIHYQRVDVERNVQRPTTFVLLEALRAIDEAAAGDARNASINDADDADDADDAGDAGRGSDDAQVEHDVGAAFGGALGSLGDEPLAPTQQDPRYRCTLEVDVDGVTHLVEDIGAGGAFIATEEPRAPGALVHLQLQARDGLPPIDLVATVMHAVDGAAALLKNRSAGMGVRFEKSAMTETVRARVHDLVTSMAARTAAESTAADSTAAESAAADTTGASSFDDEEDVVAPALTSDEQPGLALPASAMLDALAEIDFQIATGDLTSAHKILLELQAAAPDDDDLKKRLKNVNAQLEAARASAYLRLAEGALGKPDALENARRAMQLWPSREVLLRALAVFAHAQTHVDIAAVAGRLLELDAEDEGAMRTWLDANVALKRWSVAIKTAEALLRRRPNDELVKQLLQRLLVRARQR